MKLTVTWPFGVSGGSHVIIIIDELNGRTWTFLGALSISKETKIVFEFSKILFTTKRNLCWHEFISYSILNRHLLAPPLIKSSIVAEWCIFFYLQFIVQSFYCFWCWDFAHRYTRTQKIYKNLMRCWYIDFELRCGGMVCMFIYI